MFSTKYLSYPWFMAICAAGGIVLVLCWACFRRVQATSGEIYPPGPTSKNVLFGNLSDIPRRTPWIVYSMWQKLYGDIVHIRVFQQHMVLLNSLDAAKELLDKRSATYSDRPHLTMIDIMDWDFNTGLKHYGLQWKHDRRALHELLGPSTINDYKPVITEKVNDMLYQLLLNPDDFVNHYRTVTVAIIMRLIYGYDVVSKDDPYIGLAESAVQKLSDSVFLGAALVNAIPVLRYLPSWFPGAGFKKYANESKELIAAMRNAPFAFVEKSITSGNYSPSFSSRLLSAGESQDFVKNLGATIYSGASDTTSAALGTFFLAMVLNPEVQAKAQEEIDSVVGQDRLPDLDDRSSLCYIEAIYREVLRWRPVIPLGVAHATTENDNYSGYLIPKGCIMVPNVWAMTRDSKKYEDPESFNPDRHLNQDERLIDDDMSFIFGFGRRICPGRHLSSPVLWLTMVSVLSIFSIEKKKDIFGKDIPISGEYSEGMSSHPLPFHCSIMPRSEDKTRLVVALGSGTVSH